MEGVWLLHFQYPAVKLPSVNFQRSPYHHVCTTTNKQKNYITGIVLIPMFWVTGH